MSGPIVLVGHSYGGDVISNAAIGNDKVKALVYLNGWMCDEGESQQELLERFEGSLVGPSIRPVHFTSADGSEGADLFLAPEAFRRLALAPVRAGEGHGPDRGPHEAALEPLEELLLALALVAHPSVEIDECLDLVVAGRGGRDNVPP